MFSSQTVKKKMQYTIIRDRVIWLHKDDENFVQRGWRKWFVEVREKFWWGTATNARQEWGVVPRPILPRPLAAPSPKFFSNLHEWACLPVRKRSIAHHSYLWAVSWASVNAVPNPVSLLRVQLVSLWHIPFKSAKPKQRNTKKVKLVATCSSIVVKIYFSKIHCSLKEKYLKNIFFFWTGYRMRQEEMMIIYMIHNPNWKGVKVSYLSALLSNWTWNYQETNPAQPRALSTRPRCLSSF